MTVDILITNTLNGMCKSLDDEQLQLLKNVLYIQLHDVEISNKCFDIVKRRFNILLRLQELGNYLKEL